MATPVIRFLTVSGSPKEDESWHEIAAVSDLAPGEVTQVEFNKMEPDGWMSSMRKETVFVNRKKDGSCAVFDPHCTHLGCEVAWNAGANQFQCPCHGGKYDANGNRIAGPPPRPLRQYETRVINGVLVIGKQKV